MLNSMSLVWKTSVAGTATMSGCHVAERQQSECDEITRRRVVSKSERDRSKYRIASPDKEG
jgi:hypothetical protein